MITWTETTPETTVSSHEAMMDPDAIVDAIYTRRWERGPAARRETLTAYVGCRHGHSFDVRWTWQRANGEEIDNSWTGWTTAPRTVEGPLRDAETAEVAAGLDPTSTVLPADCPAWAWTAADVAEYRGLASADSARRWLNEVGVIHAYGRDTETPAKLYNGHDVVRAVARMVGHGVGGGRPRRAVQEDAR